ncbi:hypothetical protein PPERSA_10586 [Pseudocohnilembus persalinus]|uniref:COMM domain-containing protein n=1 Tax=Pseudocohnilembus persalinus TaxID=266149 RepID=A0A0V0Q9G2_PSEPJ|nr:hypothetical protein PPERSA_10586 [Pseudocohnilembus persalinus]|eukprot:KRW98815.1 hypothetical protein PPERSA_10586 [Pseudocohnilembus persalinus]
MIKLPKVIAQKKEFSLKQITQFLAENTVVNEELQNLIIEKYQHDITQQAINKTLTLGKLLDLKWQVCSYLDDKKYENINKMYIILKFTVQNQNGKVQQEQISLSLTEFKAFQQNIREIQETASQYSTHNIQEQTEN